MDLINLDSDDEQENNNPWEQAYSGKNGYVFLIDARKPMFHGVEKFYFLQSFECCLEAMLQIAREQRYDMVSFVLFGTSKSEGKFAPANVVLLRPLQTPSVTYISKIKEMIAGNFADVETYGQAADVSLDKAINYCKSLLIHCKTKLYNKSIVVFTNDDDPCKDNDDSAHAARKRAEEIYQHKIDLDVVGLGEFDSSKFYKELVLTSKGELLKNWEGIDPVKKIEDVQKEIGCISKKFNRHFGTFYLGGDAKFKIMLYKLYHEPQKLMWTSKNTVTEKPEEEHEPVEENAVKQEDEGSAVFRDLQQDNTERSAYSKPNKYPLIGGRYIPMTKAELKWFEAKCSKGLTLIGFRPISLIPTHLVEGEPCFVVPDTRDKASAELFSIFLESCLQKNVAALCWYALTKSASPSPIILFPVESSEYAKGKKHPAGFHAIKIPFSDMINDCSENSGFSEIEASESQKEAADEIIKKTTINWTPDTFNDVEYKTRIAMIEAIAMEYPEAPLLSDNTDIDLSDIADHLGDLNEKFIDCSHLPPETLGKRAKENARETSAKEAKITDSASLITLIKSGKAQELTVAQLKEVLRGEGIKSLSAMTKPRLVAIANTRFLSNN